MSLNKQRLFLIFSIHCCLITCFLCYYIYNTVNNKKSATKSNAFIFIGGKQRSGTSLMRAILDVHSKVKCGEEASIFPSFLSYISKMNIPAKDIDITRSIIDTAAAQFLSSIILNRNFKAERQCVKDPNLMYFSHYLYTLFPNAKFIIYNQIHSFNYIKMV